MSLSTRIDAIARSAARTDADDPPGLVALRDALTALRDLEEVAAHDGARTMLGEAVVAIEHVVLRDVEAPEDELAKVHETIDFLQDLVEAAASGLDAPEPPHPSRSSFEIDPELFGAWVSSSEDALNEIEAQVLALVAGESGDDAVAETRRRIHTIKGECGVVSAHAMQALFHEAESALDRAAEAGKPFPADEILDLVDWSRRHLEGAAPGSPLRTEGHDSLLARLRRCGSTGSPGLSDPPADAPGEVIPEPADTAHPGDAPVPGGTPAEPADAAPSTGADDLPAPGGVPPEPADLDGTERQAGDEIVPADALVELVAEEDEMLAEFVSESREHLVGAEAALLELESSPDDPELVNTIFRAFHTIKGVAGFLNLTPVVDLAHKAEFLLDAARNGTARVGPGFLSLTFEACDLLSTLLDLLEGGAAPRVSEYQDLYRRLDAALGRPETSGDSPEAKRSAPPARSPGAFSAAPSPPPPPSSAPDASTPPGVARRVGQSVKVNTQRLDALVDMVGELVIGHQMVVQDPHIQDLSEQRTTRNLAHVGKIIRDLQEVAMSLRMVTLSGAFQKMTRLVRDLSAKSGKTINLRVEGEETELDRNVVEEIGDPLVHMIRNACDHGIEGPEERVRAGKAPAGNLTLKAFHKGGEIIIEVGDDGRGLKREKILARAIERGIVASDREGEEMSDREVHQLIFAPGFSTAEQVTDLSGRGVGMDVVRRNIQALRGKVEIRSTPGRGSTFVLSLPLTMAIIDGMVIRCGVQRYVLPTLSIEQSFRPDRSEINTVMGRAETVMVRGSLLPIYRLSSLFGIEEGSSDPEHRLLVVLEASGSRCCLEVDELLGQQQVVIKTLGHGIGRLQGVSGGAILGDGRVAPIIDVVGLLALAQGLPVDDTSAPEHP
ncbi:MAG: chemotaxis protein CheW [Phycisphaerales bacterium JB059]